MMKSPATAPGHIGPGDGHFAGPYGDLAVPMQPPLMHPLTHDEELVRVVASQRRCRGRQFNLVTPFAGKAFCFTDYMRGLRRLPLGDAHAVWYDNSNDMRFQKRLLSTLKSTFKSWTLLEDRNPQHTVESTSEYGKISYRCYRIYKELYENRICGSLPLCLNIEDDVEVPADTWDRLTSVLDDYPEVGTVAGSCSSRRMKDSTASHPIAFNFIRQEVIGGETSATAVTRQLLVPKPLGVEAIGASHMGCWLTRTPLIKKLGIEYGTDGVGGTDVCWGYRLNLAGYRAALNWSVRTRHYYQHDGQKLYV